MARMCPTCKGDLADFIYFCPSCMHIFRTARWDRPMEQQVERDELEAIGKLLRDDSSGHHSLSAKEKLESIHAEYLICIFCERVYSDPNTSGCECGDYKGIMTIAEWESQTGEKYR